MLNGTGEKMYQQMGFERIGYGMTWWLKVDRLEANPPTSTLIAFAEAIGRGDIDTLDGLKKQIGSETFKAPLTNGVGPMELTVELSQTTSAQWLVDQGATLDERSALGSRSFPAGGAVGLPPRVCANLRQSALRPARRPPLRAVETLGGSHP